MTLRAWAPATRGMPLPTIGAVLALAVAATVIVLLDGGRDLSGALVAAAIIGASAVAFAVEDPAGETLSASPTSLARRRSLRLSAIALALALTWMVVVAIAAGRGPLTGDELALRAAEIAAVSGLAAAASGIGHRRGVASAGPVGAVAGALCMLMISSLAFRFHQLPALTGVDHHERWWLVGLAGWAAAAWTWRDPVHSPWASHRGHPARSRPSSPRRRAGHHGDQELSVGPLVAVDDQERAARQARLQKAEASFEPLPFDASAARVFGRVAASLRRSGA